MKHRAIILLSGGLDSVANLYLAQKEASLEIILALTFHYGQKSAQREIQVARYHVKKLGIPHKVLKSSLFSKYSDSALTSGARSIPLGKQEVDITDFAKSQKSAEAVWVPNRNGIFLNVAAFFAESIGAQLVLIGFNQEEAQTFADNTKEFLDAANDFFSFSTRNQVKVHSYTISLNKSQIVKQLGSDFAFESLWPCYQNLGHWCGECESCQRFRSGLRSCGYSWEDYVTKNQVFIRSLGNL
jgi:7-cyano-7-deazaguanine synthase